MRMQDYRYWILDATESEDTSSDNRLNEVTSAAQMPMVGLVDETLGGVVGYLQADAASDIVNTLNVQTL